MSKKSKRKGYLGEYNLVKKLTEILPSEKWSVQRVPLSGQTITNSSFVKHILKQDIIIIDNETGKMFFGEVKVRKKFPVFSKFYKILETDSFVNINDVYVLTTIDNMEQLLTNVYNVTRHINDFPTKQVDDFIKNNDLLFIKLDRKNYLVLRKISGETKDGQTGIHS